MKVTKELIYEILRIAEDTVEDATTERVFFGYDDTDDLTFEGQQAYDRIVMAFRVAEIKGAFPDEQFESGNIDGTPDSGGYEVLHLWGNVLHLPISGSDDDT